jgi:hypothetical protein
MHGCEIWFLTLREEHDSQKFESKDIGKVTGPMPNDNATSLQYCVADTSATLTHLGNVIRTLHMKTPTVTAVTFFLRESSVWAV